MALKTLSSQNGIFVEESERIDFERNGQYQTDFKIIQDNVETRVTIFANQPVYCKKGRFYLAPKEIVELMCYSPFSVKEVICHDIRDSGLSKKIKEILESLSF